MQLVGQLLMQFNSDGTVTEVGGYNQQTGEYVSGSESNQSDSKSYLQQFNDAKEDLKQKFKSITDDSK